jgi:hypothetical protein
MPTSKVHGYRTSYSAPVTQKVGAKQPQETLQEFLKRIKQQEKEIPIVYEGRYTTLADVPAYEWSVYVANLWEATT